MASLRPQDYGYIQRYIAYAHDYLARYDLHVTVETDMAAWAAMMRSAPKILTVNPTYDPQHSYLHPGNCFWLRVDHGERTVACIANRLFVTDDYIALKRSLRLWYDLKPTLVAHPINIVLGDHVPFIAGRVGHHGGLWVHPDFRRIGLSSLLPRLIRKLSLRHFEIDWHCGLVLQSLADSGLAIRGYGYPRVEFCMDGYFPPTGRFEKAYMPYISRDEILDQLVGDLEGLEADPDQQPVNALRVVA